MRALTRRHGGLPKRAAWLSSVRVVKRGIELPNERNPQSAAAGGVRRYYADLPTCCTHLWSLPPCPPSRAAQKARPGGTMARATPR